jgi:lipopolysaccharide biosynthesis glycosyltransferase
VENFPIKERDHVSLATYYRLFAPVILPKDMDRILYLDCDMIIDGPINSMYHDDIGNAALACVLDEDYMSEKKYDRLDLEYTRTYFNAGMLLINLDYWRRHNVYERCMECISRIPEKLILHDQDTLNVVLKDEVKHIPMKYNMQTAFLYTKTRLEDSVREELLETLDTPVIIHYTGSRKPWLRHYYHPYLDHFRYYLGISRWKDIPLTKIFKEEWRYWRHSIKFALKIKKYPFIIKTVNRKR